MTDTLNDRHLIYVEHDMTIELSTSIVNELRSALGESVRVDVASRELASRTCIPYEQMPSAVVYPTCVEDVRTTVRLAHKFGIPIWPVSTGKNWGYGETVAAYPGGITMILEKMNRICHVDEELAYAVVEPGVTYKQFSDYLASRHPSLWADAPGTTQYASVVGNALEKGRGLTPYADHFGTLCGLDVVLPDGTLMETGGGPHGKNHVRHTYKHGVGPSLDGLFAQSNLGIVVRAGVWLMPAPECFDWMSFEFTAPTENFGAFVDDLRKLVLTGALRAHPHVANDFAMMCIVAQYPFDRLNGRPCLSESALKAWCAEHGVKAWTFGCGLYGSRLEVKFQREALRRTLGRYGRVQFLGAAAEDTVRGRVLRRVAPMANRWLGKSRSVTDALLPAIDLYRGIPTDHFVRQAYVKSHARKPDSDIDAARDRCGLVWLGPMVPFTSKHVLRALSLAKETFARHSFDVFVEVMIESARSIILLIGVFYDRHDTRDADRARAWYADAHAAFLGEGYPPYRAATMSMAGTLDVNPPARNFLDAIKTALDPKNVIAPGRYGVGYASKDDMHQLSSRSSNKN